MNQPPRHERPFLERGYVEVLRVLVAGAAGDKSVDVRGISTWARASQIGRIDRDSPALRLQPLQMDVDLIVSERGHDVLFREPTCSGGELFGPRYPSFASGKREYNV